jgi:hypothetical protein
METTTHVPRLYLILEHSLTYGSYYHHTSAYLKMGNICLHKVHPTNPVVTPRPTSMRPSISYSEKLQALLESAKVAHRTSRRTTPTTPSKICVRSLPARGSESGRIGTTDSFSGSTCQHMTCTDTSRTSESELYSRHGTSTDSSDATPRERVRHVTSIESPSGTPHEPVRHMEIAGPICDHSIPDIPEEKTKPHRKRESHTHLSVVTLLPYSSGSSADSTKSERERLQQYNLQNRVEKQMNELRTHSDI